MRELAILTFRTLDGVVQAPRMPEEDRSGGFDKGGWATPYWDGVMAQVQDVAMSAPYDMLFGRKTYELFAAHWPHAEDGPATRMMNSAKKYVVTSTLTDLAWQNSRGLSGDIVQKVARLKAEDGPLLQIHGSGELIRLLHARGLIDEYRLWTFPVVVGSGKRLFDPGHGGEAVGLKLAKLDATADGVVMTIYRRR